MNNSTIQAIRRCTDSGLCEPCEVLVDDDGVPVTVYGYEYSPGESVVIWGWGDLDGPARAWAHDAGAFDVLIPG
jgi:hypothetical protein